MRFFRRRDKALRPLGEAEAYARIHGERTDVKIVHLPPRRKRYRLDVTGEGLRRRFEERIAEREPSPARAPEEPKPDAIPETPADGEAEALPGGGGGEVGDEPVLGEELAGLLEAEVARRDQSVRRVEIVEGD
jgi:hypothetical protein